MIKRALSFLISLVLLCETLSAQTELKLFETANKTYRSGNYADASKQFESIIASGNKASEIYYNLGNCYYKQQDFAKAILNYERAKLMNPLDEDISYNLKLANANTVDKIEPVPQLFYERWWIGFITFMSPSGWSVLAISLMWIAFATGIWYLFAQSISAKKLSFLSSIIILISAVFFFFVTSCSHSRIYNEKAAIVLEANAYVKSSPDDKSTSLFMLHSGTKIQVIDELSGWKQIRIANGNTGWIETKNVEVI